MSAFIWQALLLNTLIAASLDKLATVYALLSTSSTWLSYRAPAMVQRLFECVYSLDGTAD